jgi:hypothetical protein
MTRRRDGRRFDVAKGHPARRRVTGWLGAALVVAASHGALGGRPAGAETYWLQAYARTEGSTGQQVSYFRAFATLDQAGTQEVAVPRICVRGTGHGVQERCVDGASTVEVVERTEGLSGLGNKCVEALATATTPVGPLTATARACP